MVTGSVVEESTLRAGGSLRSNRSVEGLSEGPVGVFRPLL